MDFQPHTPPTQQWTNPVPAHHIRRRIRPWVIVLAILVVLLGGGYLAYSKGYLPLPFLTPDSDTILEKLSSSFDQIKTGEYRLGIRVATEPKQAGATSIFVNENTNTAATDTGYNLGVLDAQTPRAFFAALPNDLDISGAITVAYESEKDPADANGKLRIDGSYTGGDLTAAVDVEVRKIEKDLFLLISKFPSLPFYDLAKLKGTWVEITPEDNEGEFLNNWYDDTNQKETVDALKQNLAVAIEQKLLSIDEQLGTDTITGVRSNHYRVKIDPSVLQKTYEELIRIYKEKGKPTDLYEDALKDLQDEETRDIIDRVIHNSTFEIWVDKVKGIVRQAQWHIAIVPPESLSNFKDKQLTVEVTATVDKVNEIIVVDRPTETIDLYEALGKIAGQSDEEILFNRQVARVSKAREVLRAYKEITGGYPASLKELNEKLPELAKSCDAPGDTNTDQSTTRSGISLALSLSPPIGIPLNTSYNCTLVMGNAGDLEITDVITKKDYPFALVENDYELRYQLQFYPEISSYISDQYVDGENIATSLTMSKGAKNTYLLPPVDYDLFDTNSPVNSNLNTNVNSPTNTNVSSNTNTTKTNTNSANTNTVTAPQEVTFTPLSSSFSTALASFRFSIEDPAGVQGITVRGFGSDWDPFQGITLSSDPKLVSGSPKSGVWELKAVMLSNAGFTQQVGNDGWYVVWRRQAPTDGIDFYHGAANGNTYKSYGEAQQNRIEFNTIRTGVPADGDADGLADEVEPLYGTNTNVADSDGDGYSDGTEVANGYNPNGDGRLY